MNPTTRLPATEQLLRLAGDIRQSAVLGRLSDIIGMPVVQALRQSAEAAEKELNEPRADVAVIGSFSSGKSTLLNKLLGVEVLPAGRGVVTTRPVWLMSGERLRVGLWDRQSFTEKAMRAGQPLSRWVLEAQETPEEGWLRVELPEWPLGAGVRLLDTPGFNSEVSSHHAHTAEALKHAEVALVIVEPRGMSADVRDFLREHVMGKVPSVAFVLNQLDLVDASEVVELVERCRTLARTELGLPDAPVMVCSARGVVDAESGLDGWKPVRAWLEDLARSQVPVLVSRKMSGSLRQVLARVRTGVEEEGSRLKAARTMLEAEIDRHDSNLTSTYRKEMMQLFQQQAEVIQRKANMALQAEQPLMDQALESWLQDDESDLLDEDEVNGRLKALLHRLSERMDEELRQTALALHESMSQAAQRLDRKLGERWREIVRQLPNPTQGPVPGDALPLVQAQWDAQVSVGDLPSAVPSVLTGAAAGAVAGSVIPIVGTALGGLLGGVVGWLFSDPQEEARKQIRSCATDQREKLLSHAESCLKQLTDECERQLQKVLKRRLTLFRKRLAAAFEELQDRQAALTGRERIVTAASQELEGWLSRAER